GIVAVDPRCIPAGRLEALDLIDAVGERQCAIDRNAVVVKEHDQLVQLEMPRECNRFLADAFHQVAVGCNHMSLVSDDAVTEHCGEMLCGDCHAVCSRESLPERSRGPLATGRVPVFG